MSCPFVLYALDIYNSEHKLSYVDVQISNYNANYTTHYTVQSQTSNIAIRLKVDKRVNICRGHRPR